jgi:quercetin dioxygenase-like cupin family protein
VEIPAGDPIELPEVEWCVSDGIFIKQMAMDKAGILVPQHSHKYDHTSMLASGSVRVWKDGVYWQDAQAPLPIFIEAGVKHTFMSLEPSVIYCIHRNDRTGSVEIVEEHQLEDAARERR